MFISRYCTKPTELIVQSLPPKNCEVSVILRDLILTKKYFLLEHRYDPSEIYSDEFEDELKAIPDPKKEPIECLDQFLSILDEFGPWCADRAALNLIAQIEKAKIKTPYERHYLLFCLVSTTLIQVRAFCEHIFQLIPNDKQCIETYSSPKALRLLDILRQFKPEKVTVESNNEIKKPILTKSVVMPNDENKMIETTKTDADKCIHNEYIDTRSDIASVTDMNDKYKGGKEHIKDLEIVKTTTPKTNSQTGGKKTKGGFSRPQRPFNHNYQNDPNALCGLLLCNSMFSAKILFSFIYEMTKHDTDLGYLSVQYTGDRVADPITESKQFENEHRKQEEVLKRFRMHSCNLLIGTSVLEEGIELPKCNLVIRWNLPTTYRSYVQCKGRARAQRAFHIIMVAANTMHNSACKEFLSDQSHVSFCRNVESSKCFSAMDLKESLQKDVNISEETGSSNNIDSNHSLCEKSMAMMESATEHIVKLMAQYMQIERILLKKCSNQEPSLDELIEADLYTNLIGSYKPIKSDDPDTPFVSLATAIVLVNKYCAKLPSDTFTKLTPLWRCCKTFRGNKAYYQYTVRLPINSPVKQDIYVSDKTQEKCVRLHLNSETNVIRMFINKFSIDRVFQCLAKYLHDD